MTTGERLSISVVVLTMNEERNLGACLASVAGWAREVFVVDSGSTDRTVAIAREHGATVVPHAFSSHAAQWRWALDALPVTGDWVLGLDADQHVSPELRESISTTVADGRDDIQGFFLNRRQVFRGRWIRHGGYYPKYLLKLFRPAAVRLDEKERVDHHFYVGGRTGMLRGDLIEDNKNEADMSEWIAKHTRYARLQALQELETLSQARTKGRWFGNPDERTARAKQLWASLPLYVRPLLYFFYRYVIRLGFLDGKQGFVFHFMQGLWYRLLVDINRDEIVAEGRGGAVPVASGSPPATIASVGRKERGEPRVLVCAGGMFTHGGAERMVFAALHALQLRGASIHCILNDWAYSEMADVADRYGMEWSTSAHAVRLDRHSRSPRAIAGQLRDMWRTNRDLWRTARTWRASHVLVPAHDTAVRNFFALLMLRGVGVRIVMKLCNAPVPTRFYRRLWRWGVSPVISEFVCNSDFTRQELAACGVPDRKTSIIYETLPDRPAPAPATSSVPGRIIFVGQIIPEKGLHVLLDAVALLLERGLDVHLNVVGQTTGWTQPSHGSYRTDVMARGASPDLQGRVAFLGWREDVPALMQSASIHCCPSLPDTRESFGLVVLEAKAAARPSVVFRSGALSELVTHGEDGWVCEHPTAEDLAEGLAHFLSSPAHFAAACQAAHRSADRYKWDVFARAWQSKIFRTDAEAGAGVRTAAPSTY